VEIVEVRSSEHLQGIGEEILGWIDSRDSVYGLDWMYEERVPLSSFVQDLKRKTHGIGNIIENGLVTDERKALLCNELKDLLGYAFLLYKRAEELR